MATLRRLGLQDFIVVVLCLAFLAGTAQADYTNRTTLLPNVPSDSFYLQENLGYYEFYEFNATSDDIRAFTFVIARDTTRAPLVVYKSTTTKTPTYFNNAGFHTFTSENSAWTIPFTDSSQHTIYYFGVTIAAGYKNTGAYFTTMVTTYGLSDFYASNDGNIELPHGRLLVTRDAKVEPSLMIKWKPATQKQPVFVVYAFENGCNGDMNVNILSYVQAKGIVIKNETVTDFTSSPLLNTTLTGFSKEVSAFCINLVSSSLDGSQSSLWMAETLYYPHEGEPVAVPPINWKAWDATTWVEIALGSCLLVGAPLGILGHRIWIAKRRRQKQRLAGLHSNPWQTLH